MTKIPRIPADVFLLGARIMQHKRLEDRPNFWIGTSLSASQRTQKDANRNLLIGCKIACVVEYIHPHQLLVREEGPT